jgi:Calcium-binding EGF domain/EGF domain
VDNASDRNLVGGGGLGRSTYCHKVSGSDNSYVTKSISLLFQAKHIAHGDLPGTCPSVCVDVCKHKPCVNDSVVSGETCTCIPNPVSFCGNQTVCVDETCQCQPGYQGNPLAGFGCTDTNECATSSLNNCGPNTKCTNTPGSFTCECLKGYTGTPNSTTGCVDINECSNTNICGSNGVCENAAGGYICKCNPGYFWDSPDGICLDTNECLITDCGPNSNCTNTPGSYLCICLDGYASKVTPPTLAQPCVDKNECTINPTICGNNAQCTNTVGNYTCACNTGYEGTPPNCQPDVCTNAGKICAANSLCNTTVAPPACQCKSGFTGDGVTSCTDVNECANPGTCPATSNCFNEPGTFKCLIKQWQQCPTQLDATCSPGLQCAQVSRSDSKYVCCVSTGPCNNGFECCDGAYLEGEACPSKSSNDCESPLQCGRTVTDSTYRCCSSSFFNNFLNARFCN